MLNNKTRYVRYRVFGWMVMGQAADARESSWGRCTWQVGLMMRRASAHGSSKVARYRETGDRDGLCVSICTAI